MGRVYIGFGIETTCDETAVAIVENGKKILSNIVVSQVDLHKEYGGVVPEIACRKHIEVILPAIDKSLKECKRQLDEVDYIAVANRPGLIGALLVGVSSAKTLSFVLGKPLIGVNHLHAHLYANHLCHQKVEYPMIGLVVSGGHTTLYFSKSPTQMKVIGNTLDDACGEAFDKVSAILGLGYPGGPAIDTASKSGNPNAINFPRAKIDDEDFDFSFSGIKTSVLYFCKGQNKKRHDKNVFVDSINDIAASFQEAVVDVLVHKCIRACKKFGVKNLFLGGGVACNSRLRTKIFSTAQTERINVYLPPPYLCTDNAAMICALAFEYFKSKKFDDLLIDALPNEL